MSLAMVWFEDRYRSTLEIYGVSLRNNEGNMSEIEKVFHIGIIPDLLSSSSQLALRARHLARRFPIVLSRCQ